MAGLYQRRSFPDLVFHSLTGLEKCVSSISVATVGRAAVRGGGWRRHATYLPTYSEGGTDGGNRAADGNREEGGR